MLSYDWHTAIVQVKQKWKKKLWNAKIKNSNMRKLPKKHISKVKHPGNIMITILVMQKNKIKLPETQIK